MIYSDRSHLVSSCLAAISCVYPLHHLIHLCLDWCKLFVRGCTFLRLLGGWCSNLWRMARKNGLRLHGREYSLEQVVQEVASETLISRNFGKLQGFPEQLWKLQETNLKRFSSLSCLVMCSIWLRLKSCAVATSERCSKSFKGLPETSTNF